MVLFLETIGIRVPPMTGIYTTSGASTFHRPPRADTASTSALIDEYHGERAC